MGEKSEKIIEFMSDLLAVVKKHAGDDADSMSEVAQEVEYATSVVNHIVRVVSGRIGVDPDSVVPSDLFSEEESRIESGENFDDDGERKVGGERSVGKDSGDDDEYRQSRYDENVEGVESVDEYDDDEYDDDDDEIIYEGFSPTAKILMFAAALIVAGAMYALFVTFKTASL